ARAKEKGVYDALVKAELTSFLRDRRDAFDVIVSADTLVYFGDLDEVITAAARALRPGGVIVFTLEHAVGAGPDTRSRLHYHGRFSHARVYVERLLQKAGLTPAIVEAELRMEAGVPVAGLVVRAKRS